MRYELRIQDPADPPRSSLFDAVVALVNNGEVVWLRMFFGFLTGSGLNALLAVPKIREVLLHSDVEVLVGLDAVTDRPGLERLRELARKNPQFKPLVIKNTTGALIHPKMLAAKYADGRAVAVVGSNNLSSGGLSGNVECYTIAHFEPAEHLDFSDWDRFIQRWDPLITEIDDEAIEAAKQNVLRLKRVRKAATTSVRPDSGVVLSDGQVHETPVSGAEDLEEPFLVAQIPKAGGRWSQVHYSAEIIQVYFQASADADVLLRKVVYSERNKNYKIELAAARMAGEYPAGGRPVVVFRRESSAHRRHRYVFLMPGDEGHAEMAELAEQAFEGRANQVPRAIVSRSRVITAWPECPL